MLGVFVIMENRLQPVALFNFLKNEACMKLQITIWFILNFMIIDASIPRYTPYGSTPVPEHAQKIQLTRVDGTVREIFGSDSKSDVSIVIAREMAAQMRLLNRLRAEGIRFVDAYRIAPDIMEEFAQFVELRNATPEAYQQEEYVPREAVYAPFVARIIAKMQSSASLDDARSFDDVSNKRSSLGYASQKDEVATRQPSCFNNDSAAAAAALFYLLAANGITPDQARQILKNFESDDRLSSMQRENNVFGRLGCDSFVRPCSRRF